MVIRNMILMMIHMVIRNRMVMLMQLANWLHVEISTIVKGWEWRDEIRLHDDHVDDEETSPPF